MISTKSERKPLKSMIRLTDQITWKFKNRSLQNFQTKQFTSWSLCRQQRNGLNGTVKSLRRKVELCCFLLTHQVYSQKGLLCRSSHEVLTKMAAQLLEVRRRPPVALFFLFTWNVELPQTFAFKFVCHKYTSIFGPNFLVRKRWVHETASSTRIYGSCKQSIEHKTQLQ